MRSEVKALLLCEGRILLNRCRGKDGAFYYTLPGGGQNPFEPMEKALVREVREETGYRIRAGRLAAVAEEISENPEERTAFPEYAHRIHHIFLAERLPTAAETPSEPDSGQEGSEWIPVEQAGRLPLWPMQLRRRLEEILQAPGAQFLKGVTQEDQHEN